MKNLPSFIILFLLGAAFWWTLDNVLHVNAWLDYMAVITQPDPEADVPATPVKASANPLKTIAFKPKPVTAMTPLERHQAVLYLFAEERQ